MGIKLLQHHQIDFKKYDGCLASCKHARIYAQSFYLDVVTNKHWKLLVLDDYEVVMPLPLVKKMNLNWVIMPKLTQQLGVFSKNDLSSDLLGVFFNHLIKMNVINYCFHQNIKQKNTSKKINFQLHLNQDYQTIYTAYRKDRKKSLRKARNNKLHYQSSNNTAALLNIYKNSFGNDSIGNYAQKIFNALHKHSAGFQRDIYYQNQLVASGFFGLYGNRIYYLYAASNQIGKEMGATTYLIDSVLQEFSDADFVFDFEGSVIPNVFDFYKSFGAEQVPYYIYEPRGLTQLLLSIKHRII